MRNAINTVCDNCAKILQGKKGTAQIMEEYLELRGSLCLNVPRNDDSRHNYNFYYASQKGDITPLHFCVGNCLQEFLEARKYLVEEGRMRKVSEGGYGDSEEWFNEKS